MTVEGTFPLGAAVAVANISHGMSPYLATLLALLAGMTAGLVTGLLYTKGKIPILLAGILTMTAIYSINLRIMGGSNISLIGKKTLLNNEFLENLIQKGVQITENNVKIEVGRNTCTAYGTITAVEEIGSFAPTEVFEEPALPEEEAE